MLARANIELPTVPRTGDDALGKNAFRQRTALMRAHAVEGKELPIAIEQGHDLLANDRFQANARRAIGNVGDAVPRHWKCPP
jgi:hypothetical protein